MKTKRTSTAKFSDARANSDAPPPATMKSPAQARDLTEKDRAKLGDFLNKTDKPFSVTTFPVTKKRKHGSAGLQTQSDLFEDRLTVQYEVKPSNNWESLRRYKKFTVGSESVAVNECILVKHDDSEEARIDLGSQWKAKVLEVRALDSEHVYIRVAWLNRPEDLDSGRKAYHGKNELIPTNQMDIIDAMAVNGKLNVYQWNEADEDAEMPDPDEFFWRQTYDFVNTKTFSKLRPICQDATPQNPDQMIIQCSNKECRKWLHLECIAEEAVERASGSPDKEPTVKRKKSIAIVKTKAKRKSVVNGGEIGVAVGSSAAAQNNAVSAQVYIAGASKEKPVEKHEIVVTDANGEEKSEEVRCLLCRESIE